MATPTTPRLGRLAIVAAIVGAVAYGVAVLLVWTPFGPTGSVRYSTEPPVDWLTIRRTAAAVLGTFGLVVLATALVLALVVLVRWAVARRPTRAS
jgi:predicted PurR-regulated permease PerM